VVQRTLHFISCFDLPLEQEGASEDEEGF
jgi:hypothetical protein